MFAVQPEGSVTGLDGAAPVRKLESVEATPNARGLIWVKEVPVSCVWHPLHEFSDKTCRAQGSAQVVPAQNMPDVGKPLDPSAVPSGAHPPRNELPRYIVGIVMAGVGSSGPTVQNWLLFKVPRNDSTVAVAFNGKAGVAATVDSTR